VSFSCTTGIQCDIGLIASQLPLSAASISGREKFITDTQELLVKENGLLSVVLLRYCRRRTWWQQQ
jgi:hypothetical protein